MTKCSSGQRQDFAPGWESEKSLTFLACLFNAVWTWQNEALFERNSSLNGILYKLNSSVKEFWASREGKEVGGSNYNSSSLSIVWKPPVKDGVKINVDAAHREDGSAEALVARDCWKRSAFGLQTFGCLISL